MCMKRYFFPSWHRWEDFLEHKLPQECIFFFFFASLLVDEGLNGPFFPYGMHTLNYPSRGNCPIHVCFFWACPKELGHLSLKRNKLLDSKMLASFFKIPLILYPPEEKGFLGHGSQHKLLFQKIILPVTFLANPALKAWVDRLMFVWNGDAGRIIL